MRVVAVIVLTILTAFFSRPAVADKRIALVIGNSAYQHTAPLLNPANDAAAMADMLKGARFDVVELKRDLKALEMRRALRDFSDAAQDADVAIFYFAGHGIEIGGANYLIPVDAILEKDTDAFDEAVPVDRALSSIEPAKKLRLVILDACRDNPLAKTMKRRSATRSLAGGLAKIEPETPNTLVAFAAKAGSTAWDGADKNSPFTTALVKHLPRPGLDLRKAFGFVRDDVLKATRNRQEPFIYGSLGGEDVPLVPALAPAPEPARVPTAHEAARGDYELAMQINTIPVWDSFIRKYPSGFYADLATAQRDRLNAAAAANARPVTPAQPSAERDKTEPAQKASKENTVVSRLEPKPPEAAKSAPVPPARPAQQDGGAKSQPAPAQTPPRQELAKLVTPPAAPLLSRCSDSPVIAVSLSTRSAQPLTQAEECASRPKDSFKECDDCPEMVILPPGEVLIGSERKDIEAGMARANEAPQRRALLTRPMAVGKFEVTRDQYEAFIKSSGYKVSDRCFTFENGAPQERGDRSFRNPGFVQSGNHPAVCVSWDDARAYIDWLSRRTGKGYGLLSEAEFEYAARGGGSARFANSNDAAELCGFANGADQSLHATGLTAATPFLKCNDGFSFTAPVGSYQPNAFGLHDLIGNVWEWTDDCYSDDNRPSRPDAGCQARTVRGGDWFSTEILLRPAAREKANAGTRNDDIGFRVVRTLQK